MGLTFKTVGDKGVIILIYVVDACSLLLQKQLVSFTIVLSFNYFF